MFLVGHHVQGTGRKSPSLDGPETRAVQGKKFGTIANRGSLNIQKSKRLGLIGALQIFPLTKGGGAIVS